MSKHTRNRVVSGIVFGLILAIISLVIGSSWKTSQAGYFDELDLFLDYSKLGDEIPGGEICKSFVRFDEDSCQGECVVREVHPSYPNSSIIAIKGDFDTRTYFQMVDNDGKPVEEPYTICYNRACKLHLFEENSWMRIIGIPERIDLLCYTHNGDQVFAITY